MDFVQALILSIVEGITEFLPISSTGHLVLASEILGIHQTEFVKSFEIFIQLGAILAVVILYFQKYSANFKAWRNIVLAFIPTAIIGLIFYQVVKDILLGNMTVTLLAIFLGGLVLIFIDRVLPHSKQTVKSVDQIKPKEAIIIGLIQSISIIPGISRAASTIIGGLILGLPKSLAVEFSFLLAVPTLLAAAGLDLIKTNFQFSSSEWISLTIGFIGSFISALIVIKWFIKFVSDEQTFQAPLIKYIQNHSFFAFGIYRVILAVVFWMFIL
jgi:undecaprenyl-diphosphatase